MSDKNEGFTVQQRDGDVYINSPFVNIMILSPFKFAGGGSKAAKIQIGGCKIETSQVDSFVRMVELASENAHRLNSEIGIPDLDVAAPESSRIINKIP